MHADDIMKKLEVSLLGGSGYAGGELLRILLLHPHVRVLQATSSQYAGQPVSVVHPNLRGLTSLRFSLVDDLKPCDMLFCALPNGESMRGMGNWIKIADQVIDTGADFRLGSPQEWKEWYGTDHTMPELLGQFIYGIPELDPERIRGARYVAGPGCEAVVSILSLFPFLKNGLIRKEPLIVDAKMGSSQSGHGATSATHHPERAGAVRSYKPTGHRHAGEIARTLAPFGCSSSLHISATAVEMVRGILVTIHSFLNKNVTEKDIWAVLRTEFKDKPFIRIVKQKKGLYRYPEPKILQGTNFCEIGFEKADQGDRLVILGAIDNLGKGTAGNAVQCMNLMAGFPETSGLEFPGLHPV